MPLCWSQRAQSSVRFHLEQRDGCMAYSFLPPKASEPVWTSVCDFILLELVGLFQFVEDDAGHPYIKILCRSIIDEHGSGVITIKADDILRTPSLQGYWAIDVEVLCQPGKLKSNADLKHLFQGYNARLNASIMTPDMLSCWITEQPKPNVTSCIVRFGALIVAFFSSPQSLLIYASVLVARSPARQLVGLRQLCVEGTRPLAVARKGQCLCDPAVLQRLDPAVA